MRKGAFLLFLSLSLHQAASAVDLYGATPTAGSVALGGIYFGSLGPTDALASNPAGLVFSGRPTVELTAMGITSAGTFSNSTAFRGALTSGWSPSGSAALAGRVGKSRLHLGAGIFPTALLSGKWRYMDPAGTAGVSYGMQDNKSAFLAVESAFGAAYEITPRLSVGATLGFVYNRNTLETPYIFQTNPTVAGLKALLRLHTDGYAPNASVGVIAEPVRHLQIGLHYKSEAHVTSDGNAVGNTSALFNALGVTNSPLYAYRAQVRNVFPRSASVAMDWQARKTLHAYLQGDFTNWSTAFRMLPVHLTGGNNAVLNTVLQSTTLDDSVPLHWRNQYAVRTGLRWSIGEYFTFSSGYSHANSPVPAGTLTPLTAAIMKDALSTGLGWEKSRIRVQFGYQINLPVSASVDRSQILANEYNGTRTSLHLQTLALTTAFRF